MNETLRRWLVDPTIGRLAAVILGVLAIIGAVRALSRVAGRRIESADARYRVRKVITFGGYAGALLLVPTVFR